MCMSVYGVVCALCLRVTVYVSIHSPELVQNEEYNEKADIWAAGCILYEMAALKAPFHSSNNILALATKVNRSSKLPALSKCYMYTDC